MTGLHYWLQNRRIRPFLTIRCYVVDRVLRRITEPTLIDVLRGSACAVTDAGELVKNIPLVQLAEKEPVGLKDDFAVVKQQLKSRYDLAEQLRLAYPVDWAVEEQSAFALYSLVRALKPRTVVETGVANGHSSFVIARMTLPPRLQYIHHQWVMVERRCFDRGGGQGVSAVRNQDVD